MNYGPFTKELKNLFMELLPLYIGTAHGKVGTKIATKADTTSVIDLDNHTGDALRRLILSHFPHDFLIKEEDGKSSAEMALILAEQNENQWTIDGLDGTWHFIRGTNSYGAMVSRRRGNDVLYSAIFRPIDAVLRGNGFFWTAKGEGAWEWCSEHGESHQLHTAQSGQLERFTVLLEGGSKGLFKPPITSLATVETVRPSLSSCIAATTVARGDATGVVTRGNKPWDNFPIIAFVEGAGGIVTDFQGNHRSLANSGDLVAAANREDHQHIIRLLN